MFRAPCAAALIWTTLFSGCSGQRTLSQDKLKSAATETVSIAAEGELFAWAAAENRASAHYAKGAPEYLRKQAEDVVKELSQGQPDARVQEAWTGLRHAATKLIETLDALPKDRGDARWQQARSQFDNIRRQAEEIRRTL